MAIAKWVQWGLKEIPENQGRAAVSAALVFTFTKVRLVQAEWRKGGETE